MEPELKASPRLDGVEHNLVVDGIFFRPARGVRAPVDAESGLTTIEGQQDKGSATQMIGELTTSAEPQPC